MYRMATLIVLGFALGAPRTAPAGELGFSLNFFGRRSGIGLHVSGSHGGIGLHVGGGRLCRPQPPPRRVWVPGRYEERVMYVHVEGGWRRQWVPASTETVCRRGRGVTRIVMPGHWITVWEPPRRVPTTTRVWVEGYWQVVH